MEETLVRRRQRMGIAPEGMPPPATSATVAPEVPITWSWGAGNRNIEAPTALMEEIRSSVMRGALQLSHGGVEIAGLLLGEVVNATVRILAWHTLPCRHRFGPSFRLDREEEEIFHELKQRAATEGGPTPVGWFVVHSRRAAEITEEERALTDLVFPEAEAIVISLKPVAGGEVAGRVYGRPASGVPLEELLPPFSLFPRPVVARGTGRRLRTHFEQPVVQRDSVGPESAVTMIVATSGAEPENHREPVYEIPLPGFLTLRPTFGDRVKLFLSEVFK